MYHFEVRVGESPLFATVKAAPFESYVGAPEVVKSLEAPFVKAIFLLPPRAGSGGQLPNTLSAYSYLLLNVTYLVLEGCKYYMFVLKSLTVTQM